MPYDQRALGNTQAYDEHIGIRSTHIHIMNNAEHTSTITTRKRLHVVHHIFLFVSHHARTMTSTPLLVVTRGPPPSAPWVVHIPMAHHVGAPCVSTPRRTSAWCVPRV
jgi:hypothetical protein